MMMTTQSPSRLAWEGAGYPTHPYAETQGDALCAVCATHDAASVAVSDIETPTMSDHANVFRFGTRVCRACAWLFAIGKAQPGNYFATKTSFEKLVISAQSVVADKRPWCDAINDIARLEQKTCVTGVLTTDVKPRLWPRAQIATIDNFGLYVHAPDYNISRWMHFDLRSCLDAIKVIREAQIFGYAKATIAENIFCDFPRASRDFKKATELEKRLSDIRKSQAFYPALLMSNITKDQKTKDQKNDANGRDRKNVEPRANQGDRHHQGQLGLF